MSPSHQQNLFHASEDETDSLHVYDDNYEGDDDNWELYPEEPDSDVDAD